MARKKKNTRDNLADFRKISRSSKAGLPPGTLIHIGKHKTNEVKVSVIQYNKTIHKEFQVNKVSESYPASNSNCYTWINVDGLHDMGLIKKLQEHFSLDSLLLEDVLNTGHRPKVEELENVLFVNLKMLGISHETGSIVSEQVSFLLGKDWLISFQELEGDVFDNVRDALQDPGRKVRNLGPDYLLYRLIDTVIDNYFYVIEHIAEKMEELEDRVLLESKPSNFEEIQLYRKELVSLRRSTAPLREMLSVLENDTSNFIRDETRRYYRDVYEHVVSINETIEGHREMISGIRDLHMTGVSNKMNEIMKVLTIVSTIFIPLTFIAGIYGMNFDNIPELHWKYGYFIAWGVMILLTFIMFGIFKRKKWL